MSTRVVLLGASNLAIGFPSIVRRLVSGLPRPLSIFAAFGHGRSYCAWSRVLFRALPAIDECALWDDLDRDESPSRTLALVADVGNDLIYGSAPSVIAGRIESCLARLEKHGAQTVVIRLPLASVERLSALRFHATKAVFFPRTGGTWPAMLCRARELDQSLCRLAARFGVDMIEQPRDWYGFDPIHIRHRRRDDAWRTIFSAWPSFCPHGHAQRLAVRDIVRMRLAAPAERRLFGRSQRQAQPALTVSDVAIRLY